jgi:hypothetical protein
VLIADHSGYVVNISVDRLAKAVHSCRGQVEVELLAVLGDHLVPGARFAVVRGHRAEDRNRLRAADIELGDSMRSTAGLPRLATPGATTDEHTTLPAHRPGALFCAVTASGLAFEAPGTR